MDSSLIYGFMVILRICIVVAYVLCTICKDELHTLVTHQLTNHKLSWMEGQCPSLRQRPDLYKSHYFEKLTLKSLILSLLYWPLRECVCVCVFKYISGCDSFNLVYLVTFKFIRNCS